MYTCWFDNQVRDFNNRSCKKHFYHQLTKALKKAPRNLSLIFPNLLFAPVLTRSCRPIVFICLVTMPFKSVHLASFVNTNTLFAPWPLKSIGVCLHQVLGHQGDDHPCLCLAPSYLDPWHHEAITISLHLLWLIDKGDIHVSNDHPGDWLRTCI